MKQDTVVLVIKGIAFVGSAMAIQLASSLGQWANEDVWPSRINWILIIVLAFAAGFGALMGFMSSSFSNWKQDRSGNGNGNGQPSDAKPT